MQIGGRPKADHWYNASNWPVYIEEKVATTSTTTDALVDVEIDGEDLIGLFNEGDFPTAGDFPSAGDNGADVSKVYTKEDIVELADDDWSTQFDMKYRVSDGTVKDYIFIIMKADDISDTIFKAWKVLEDGSVETRTNLKMKNIVEVTGIEVPEDDVLEAIQKEGAKKAGSKFVESDSETVDEQDEETGGESEVESVTNEEDEETGGESVAESVGEEDETESGGDETESYEVELEAAIKLRIDATVAVATAPLLAQIAQLQAAARTAADAAQHQRILRMSMKDTQAALNLVNAQRGFALSKGSTCTTVYADYLRRQALYERHGMLAAAQAREAVIREEVAAILPAADFNGHLAQLNLISIVFTKGASMASKKASLVFWLITDELQQQHG